MFPETEGPVKKCLLYGTVYRFFPGLNNTYLDLVTGRRVSGNVTSGNVTSGNNGRNFDSGILRYNGFLVSSGDLRYKGFLSGSALEDIKTAADTSSVLESSSNRDFFGPGDLKTGDWVPGNKCDVMGLAWVRKIRLA